MYLPNSLNMYCLQSFLLPTSETIEQPFPSNSHKFPLQVRPSLHPNCQKEENTNSQDELPLPQPHPSLHSLAGGDDRMGGIHPCPHLVQVDVHRVHGRREVLPASPALPRNGGWWKSGVWGGNPMPVPWSVWDIVTPYCTVKKVHSPEKE